MHRWLAPSPSSMPSEQTGTRHTPASSNAVCAPRTAQLMECGDEDDYVTSVAWAADGKHVAVGTSAAQVQIWDAARGRQVRALRGHSARVSALAWHGTTLSTGGRDSAVLNHDVRCVAPASSTMHAALAASQLAGPTLVPQVLSALHIQHGLRDRMQRYRSAVRAAECCRSTDIAE